MPTTFSIPRGDYRAYPFAIKVKVDNVAQALNMAGYTFIFTVKKKITDADDEIVFEKVITIPAGPSVYTSLLEILPADSDKEPGAYWLEGTAYKDAKPITAKPVPFKITERERKTMPVIP